MHSRFGLRLVSSSLLIAIGVMTLGPINMRPKTHFSPDFERFAAYALLGGFVALAYPRSRVWLLAALLLGAAGMLEWAQHFVPGRDPRLSDFVFKGGGAIVGLIAARVFPWLFVR